MKENRNLKLEFFIVIVGRIILSTSGILLVVILLNVLDAKEYSLYVFLFSTASWLSAIVFVAANIPLLNLVSNKTTTATQTELKNVAICLSLFSYVPSMLFSAVSAFAILNFIMETEVQPTVFQCLMIGILSASIGNVALVSTYLMGCRRRLANIAVTSGFLLVRIAAITILVTIASYTAISVFNVVAATAAIGFLAAISIAYQPLQAPNFSHCFNFLRKHKFYSAFLENWPVAVGNNIFYFGDKVFLAFVLPIEAIGLLSIYQQFCRMLANFTSGAIYQFAAPILLEETKPNSAKSFYLASFYASLIFIIFALPAYFLLELVNQHLFASKFSISYLEYILIALIVGINNASRMTELFFFKHQKIRELHLPMALAIATFLVLGYFLATHYGFIGGVLALLLAVITRLSTTLIIQISIQH